MTPVALTIAGSDPSGGAGIQADLKTFHQFGVYGMAALTLATVQNTVTVSRVLHLPADFVIEQLRAVVEDIPPAAAKLGALGTSQVIEALAREAEHWQFPLVIDPVMTSTSGAALMDSAAQGIFRCKLLPLALLLTPNLQEAGALSGSPVTTVADMHQAAWDLVALGAKAVLIKGGHLRDRAVDVLYADGVMTEFTADRISSVQTHGTGCTYAAAITAGLALGRSLLDAVGLAKLYITEAIRTAPGLGAGRGPVNHSAAVALSGR